MSENTLDKTGLVGYLNCMGFKDDSGVVVKQHSYIDGNEHRADSHGVCPVCKELYDSAIKRKGVE